MNQEKVSGPSWDNSTEYKDFDDPKIKEQLTEIEELLSAIDQKSKDLQSDLDRFESAKNSDVSASEKAMQTARKISHDKLRLRTVLANLRTFANCQLSIDGGHEKAKDLLGQTQTLAASSQASFQDHEKWLSSLNEKDLELYHQDSVTETERYFVERLHLQKPYKLSLAEEKTIKNLEVHGPTSWGNLYTNLSSTIKVRLPADDHGGEKMVGVATATGQMESPDPSVRKTAYRAIEQAWQEQSEACAASLNAITGWRLSVYKQRGYKDYLDEPLFNAAIERSTLESMIAAISSMKDHSRKVVAKQAELLDLPKLGPWDLFAPAPTQSGSSRVFSFDEAIKIIKESFASINPEMSDFVQLMVDNRWIDGSVGDKKRPGAYCTGFLLSRTPRVYMTYSGGMKDVITLAHELGHAFHNWVMRDLHPNEIIYPMTLAETASILSQTVVTEYLTEHAQSDDDRLRVLWTEAREAEAFLLNIPVRFDFENQISKQRANGSLTAAGLSKQMESCWKDWYGDTLSEGNRMFWASKLHFHIPGLSFYNFPYSFGYLFSLGVLAQKDELKADFYPAYKALLRDTGKMSSEKLAKRHLSKDLREQGFWKDSLSIVDKTIEKFINV